MSFSKLLETAQGYNTYSAEAMLGGQPEGTHIIFERGTPLRKDSDGYWRKIKNPDRMYFTNGNVATDLVLGGYRWSLM